RHHRHVLGSPDDHPAALGLLRSSELTTPGATMAILELKNVSKGFGTGSAHTDVLRSIDFGLEEGEFVAIVGFSGSGKSTLMNLLAGLLKPDRGEVRFKGELNPDPGPERGLVFQN